MKRENYLFEVHLNDGQTIRAVSESSDRVKELILETCKYFQGRDLQVIKIINLRPALLSDIEDYITEVFIYEALEDFKYLLN